MKRNRGFSLIELLVAVALLSIIMLMVSQFMGTSSGALTRTKKNLNLQTEAMEVGNYLSDAIVQATYIRVRTQDKKYYTFDTTLNGNNRKARTATEVSSLDGDLVVDNYPNYQKKGETNRKVIVDETNYTLIKEDGTVYPLSHEYDDGKAKVQSFRLLTSAGGPYYVKPEYIYIRYRQKIEGSEKDAYVIFRFVGKEVYMYRATMESLVAVGSPMTDWTELTGDSFERAKLKVDASGSLLTEQLADYYFSADVDGNTVFLDMLFESKRFNQYTYNYAEPILLRNSNVLTVPPQKLYKKK